MDAEIPKPYSVVEHRARRLRDEHLPAVPGCHHPRAVVDVQPDVAALEELWLSRVKPHPNPDLTAVRPLVLGECTLSVPRRGDGLAGGGERDEERVPLHVDLETVISAERLANQVAVGREQVRVGVPGAAQQQRRALDVAEHERHCAAGGLFGHVATSIAPEAMESWFSHRSLRDHAGAVRDVDQAPQARGGGSQPQHDRDGAAAPSRSADGDLCYGRPTWLP